MNNVLEGIEEFFTHYRQKKSITTLKSHKGALARRHHEYWLDMKLAASTITFTIINNITNEHVMKLVEYQGINDIQLQRLDLNRAIQN